MHCLTKTGKRVCGSQGGKALPYHHWKWKQDCCKRCAETLRHRRTVRNLIRLGCLEPTL
jgi:hypothetical protein